MSKKKTDTPAGEVVARSARPLTDGTIIGRALTKLQAINVAEQEELHRSPAAIRDKHAKRRAELLADLSPVTRAAVLAASQAAAAADVEGEQAAE